MTGAAIPAREGAEFAFYLYQTADLQNPERRFILTAEDLALLNPNTRTCPVFRTRRDADLTRAIYRRVPVLLNERAGANPWGVEFLAMFHMSNDSRLFKDAPSPGLVPLYEAKLFHQFEHRLGTYDGRAADSQDSELPRSTPTQLADPYYQVTPRYWIPQGEVTARLPAKYRKKWFVPYRRISRATDERTLIATATSLIAAADPAMVLLPNSQSPRHDGALLGSLNAFACDYVVRQKLGGTDVRNHFFKQFAVLPPSAYGGNDLEFILPRVLELTYTAWDLKPFACDLGYDGPPFRWDEARRFLLRCELDALYFHLYGIERDDVDYIMETFPIVKRKDEQRHGEYRTKRVILEMYDAMAEAKASGREYQTRLDPPPADPRVAHPPRSADGDGVLFGGERPLGDGAAGGVDPLAVGTLEDAAARSSSAPPGSREVAGATRWRRRSAGSGRRTDRRQPGLSTDRARKGIPRERILSLCLGILRGAGSLTAAELARRLTLLASDVSADQVESVLSGEGIMQVRRDPVSGRYSLR
jgi:hypothetical protein